ncbi:hypothetical protein H8356DRAFT_1339997 [Neocallimastix lanati (nom. inval.)]|nr:hypothetical protein H8356DRAFT_1339997 [Neocallimastix sp. JGI-2020a]
MKKKCKLFFGLHELLCGLMSYIVCEWSFHNLTVRNNNNMRYEYVLPKEDLKRKNVDLYIESIYNSMSGYPNRYFALSKAEIANPNSKTPNNNCDIKENIQEVK